MVSTFVCTLESPGNLFENHMNYFKHSYRHSFNKYLLSAYYVLGSPVGFGDSSVNKTGKILALKELPFLWGRADSIQDK